MKRRVYSWLLTKLVKHCYHGLTTEDFVDTKELRDEFFETYAIRAKDVYENDTFINELKRMQYEQERYLVLRSKSADDLIFARASLYIIDLIRKRFAEMAEQANMIFDRPDEVEDKPEAHTQY